MLWRCTKLHETELQGQGEYKCCEIGNIILTSLPTGHYYTDMTDRGVEKIVIRGKCNKRAPEDTSERPSKIIVSEVDGSRHIVNIEILITSDNT